MSFTLPALPYAYNALEPFIDTKTMELHHQKHHQAYVDGLNAALKEHPSLEGKSIEALLLMVDTLHNPLKKQIEDFGGGHYNHTFFWESMRPGKDHNRCTGALLDHLSKEFGSFEQFQENFVTAGKKLFGSGWVWLVVEEGNRLAIVQTANQKTPLTKTMQPLLGLDVWEHAYYLHYQNRRLDYMQAWWHVVNWEVVQVRYAKLRNIV